MTLKFLKVKLAELILTYAKELINDSLVDDSIYLGRLNVEIQCLQFSYLMGYLFNPSR